MLHLYIFFLQPVGFAVEGDDRTTRISWRGDGEYFVCSAINPATGARQLRMWSRECVLQSTSEDMDGLEQALHWRSVSIYYFYFLCLSIALFLFFPPSCLPLIPVLPLPSPSVFFSPRSVTLSHHS